MTVMFFIVTRESLKYLPYFQTGFGIQIEALHLLQLVLYSNCLELLSKQEDRETKAQHSIGHDLSIHSELLGTLKNKSKLLDL